MFRSQIDELGELLVQYIIKRYSSVHQIKPHN